MPSYRMHEKRAAKKTTPNRRFRAMSLLLAASAAVVFPRSLIAAGEPATLESADAAARALLRTAVEARAKKQPGGNSPRILVNSHDFNPAYYGLENLEGRVQDGQRVGYPKVLRDCEVREKSNYPVRYHYEASDLPNERLFAGVKLKVLDADCAPDTLYSWGNQEKLDVFKEMLGSQESPYWKKYETGKAKLHWNNNSKAHRNLFAARWPVDSFFYGEIPIRLRLAADTKFLFVDRTGDQTSDAAGNYFSCGFVLPFRKVVIAAYWKNAGNISGLDFILCDSAPIESWSYLTHGHYEEIYRELKWISSNMGDDYDTWLRYRDLDWLPLDGAITSIDGHAVGLGELRGRLKNLWSMLPGSDQQNIFYSPYLPPEKRTPAGHFSTKIPNYSNPN